MVVRGRYSPRGKFISLSDVSLADPNADRIVFWDDSDSQFEFLEAGSNLSITTNTLNVSATPSFTSVTAGTITIFNPTPILVFKDSNSLGAASVGFIEWRDSGGGRAGFFGNNTAGDDGLLWKNEQGGDIGIQTTGAGKFQVFANTVVNGYLKVAGASTPTGSTAGTVYCTNLSVNPSGTITNNSGDIRTLDGGFSATGGGYTSFDSSGSFIANGDNVVFIHSPAAGVHVSMGEVSNVEYVAYQGPGDAAEVADMILRNACLDKDIVFQVNDGGVTKDVLTLVGANHGLQGVGATASGDESVAFQSSTASGDRSTAFNAADASGDDSFATGSGSFAMDSGDITIGAGATSGTGTGGGGNVSIGADATATGGDGLAIGKVAKASGLQATCIGFGGNTDALLASGESSVVIGSAPSGVIRATAANTMAIGVTGGQNPLIQSTGVGGSLAIGIANVGGGGACTLEATALGAIAMGYVTLNDTTTASGVGSWALGQSVVASAANAWALGMDFTNNTANTFMVGFGQVDFTVASGMVVVAGDSLRIVTSQSPASNGTGVQGEIAWDASYLYVCTSTNVWKRSALTGGY